jgi:hypothetical protein
MNLSQVVAVSDGVTDDVSLMDEVCEDADRNNTVLVLRPDGDEWLHEWYEDHGFRIIQIEPVMLMARQPYKT